MMGECVCEWWRWGVAWLVLVYVGVVVSCVGGVHRGPLCDVDWLEICAGGVICYVTVATGCGCGDGGAGGAGRVVNAYVAL